MIFVTIGRPGGVESPQQRSTGMLGPLMKSTDQGTYSQTILGQSEDISYDKILRHSYVPHPRHGGSV